MIGTSAQLRPKAYRIERPPGGHARRPPGADAPSNAQAEEARALAAWCESRQGFRNFRLDRIDTLTGLDERFQDEHGKTLDDYLAIEECATVSR